MAMTGYIMLALLPVSWAITLEPEVTSCSDSNVFTISQPSITYDKQKKRLSTDFTATISQTLDKRPWLKVKITSPPASTDVCIQSGDPCAYNLCNPETATETQLSSPWSGSCPIDAGDYRISVDLPVPPSFERYTRIDKTFTYTITVHEEGTQESCQSFSFSARRLLTP
ncbi:uncharacterized protein LOC144141628 [Haemaphysalis longicornis]